VLSFASSPEDAIVLERAGKISAARLHYGKWLEENRGSQEYLRILFHLASLSDTARDALALLNSHSVNLPPMQSAVIFARMAALESLIGLPGEAARHYELASGIGGKAGELYLLDSTKLKFVMGAFSEARETALRLVNSAQAVIVRDEAAAIAALSLAYMGGGDDALEELLRYSSASGAISTPYFWLATLDIAQSYGYASAEAMRALTSNFSNSTAEHIAKGRILRWNIPGALLESIATRVEPR